MEDPKPDPYARKPNAPDPFAADGQPGGSFSTNKSTVDGQQFVELLGAHERLVFRYIYSLTASWDDAEEIMQRVRVRLWQQFENYDEEKSFAGWARAIAYYLVLAYRKEKSRRVFSESVLEQLKMTYDDATEDLDARHEAMLDCLEKLSLEKRELVADYYSGHGAIESVAEKLGMTVAALRQSLYRVRKKLHQCIQIKLGSAV